MSEPVRLPTPIKLPPHIAGGTLRLATWVSRELTGQFDAGRLLLAVARASTVGGSKPRAATARGQATAARRIATNGIDYQDALPALQFLVDAQESGRTTPHARAGKPDFLLRHTLVRVADTPLLLSLITGSGNQLDTDLLQPTSLEVAALLETYQPALLVAPELSRLGRDQWSFRELVHAYQRIHDRHGQRAWLAGKDDLSANPDAMFLEPFTEATEDRLVRAGKHARAEARQFESRGDGGARTLALENLTMADGRVFFFRSGAVIPGFAKVRSATDKGRRGPNIVFPDRPADRPAEDDVSERLPQVFEDDGTPVDQVETLRWLFRTADRPGWTDVHVICAELERRRFSTDGLRRLNQPDTRFRAGGDADRKMLDQIMNRDLDCYYHRVMRERLGDGGDDLLITGLPWFLSDADYRRLRKRWAGRLRDRIDAHLYTGAEVLVDGQFPGVLEGQTRNGRVVYVVRRPGSTDRVGTREAPVPPIPQDDLLLAELHALAGRGATLFPPAVETPAEADRLQAAIASRAVDIAEKERDQHARKPMIDPARRKAGDQAADPVVRAVEDLYRSTDRELVTLRAAQAEEEVRLRDLRERRNLHGLPVGDLWKLTRILDHPEDRSLRFPILDSLDGPIQLRRPVGGMGYAPDKPPWFGFLFTVHDQALGPRQAWAEAEYATSGQLRGAARVRQILDQLAAGLTARQQRLDVAGWRPRIRDALGDDGPLTVLAVDDSWLLEVRMAVCHPLPPLHLESSLEDRSGRAATPPRLAGPPVDEAGLEDLARERGWPLPLLRRIRSRHLDGERRTGRWLYNPAPVTSELYAAARRRGRIRVDYQQGLLLSTDRTGSDWDIDGDTATLRPCARCSTRRIHTSRLTEVTGGLCVGCHHDRAAVPWPRRYDAYLGS